MADLSCDRIQQFCYWTFVYYQLVHGSVYQAEVDGCWGWQSEHHSA